VFTMWYYSTDSSNTFKFIPPRIKWNLLVYCS